MIHGWFLSPFLSYLISCFCFLSLLSRFLGDQVSSFKISLYRCYTFLPLRLRQFHLNFVFFSFWLVTEALLRIHRNWLCAPYAKAIHFLSSKTGNTFLSNTIFRCSWSAVGRPFVRSFVCLMYRFLWITINVTKQHSSYTQTLAHRTHSLAAVEFCCFSKWNCVDKFKELEHRHFRSFVVWNCFHVNIVFCIRRNDENKKQNSATRKTSETHTHTYANIHKSDVKRFVLVWFVDKHAMRATNKRDRQ